MVNFSSAAGYVIFAQQEFSWCIFSLLLGGGLMVTFAANALNQALEPEFDKLMVRTAHRPIAAERMSISMAVLISGILCTIGVVALAAIGPIAALLGMVSFLMYAFLYTPLKRYSTIAVPVGAVPGALPVLIGAIAAQGYISIEGFCLFAIQFLWQFPHFWAIAWMGHNDYTKAGFKLIKDVGGRPDHRYGLYGCIYAAMSLFFLLPMYLNGDLHLVAAFLIAALMLAYAFFSFRLYIKNNQTAARGLMLMSIVYLPLVLILFILNASM